MFNRINGGPFPTRACSNLPGRSAGLGAASGSASTPPLACLHLPVSVFVGVAAALALPSELLQLGLAALDGLGLGPPLALVLLQGGLRANRADTRPQEAAGGHFDRRVTHGEVFNIQLQLLLQLGQQLRVEQLQLVTERRRNSTQRLC